MEQDDAISFLDEPITKWWQWLAVFLPFLFFIQTPLLLYSINDNPFYTILLVTAGFTFLGTIIFLVVGLVKGLPNWIFPSTGFWVGILGTIFSVLISGNTNFGIFANKLEWAYIVLSGAFATITIYGPGYLISILVVNFGVLIPKYKQMTENARWDLSWLSLLFYCGAFFVPFAHSSFIQLKEQIFFMAFSSFLFGLGIWLFLRSKYIWMRFLILIGTILPVFGSISLLLYLHYKQGPQLYPWDYPYRELAFGLLGEGLGAVILIAFPAVFMFYRYQRSIKKKGNI